MKRLHWIFKTTMTVRYFLLSFAVIICVHVSYTESKSDWSPHRANFEQKYDDLLERLVSVLERRENDDDNDSVNDIVNDLDGENWTEKTAFRRKYGLENSKQKPDKRWQNTRSSFKDDGDSDSTLRNSYLHLIKRLCNWCGCRPCP